MLRPWLPIVPLLGLGLSWSLASGCATDAPIDEEVDSSTPAEDASRDTSTADTFRPPVDSGRDTSTPDSSRPDSSADATTDARADATPTDSGIAPNPGEDFDPAAPKTGDTCPAGVAEFDIVSRRCGKCGVQRAFCEAGRVVGTYGACTNEKVDTSTVTYCKPNAVEVGLECGLCGSQVRKCEAATCVWSTGVCLGEVNNGCVKNEVTYVEGVCPTAEQTRKQTCSPTCTRGAPEACAVQSADVLTASQTVGNTVEGTFSLTNLRTIPRLNSGACPTSSSTIQVNYHYLQVRNTGTDSINVTVSHEAPSSGAKPNTYISAYLGLTAPPADATARQNCVDAAKDTPESITVNIPAGQSAFVLSTGSAAGTTGRVQFVVKTNFIGAEPPPAVDHDVVLGPNVGDSVTQALTFVATQVTERVSTGTCPRTLATTLPAYRYIRLANNTATAKTVDLSLDDPLDSVIAVYAGPTPPLSSARGNCIGTVNDFCPTAAGIATADSCLTGVSVPAMGSIIVYAAPYSATSGTTTFRATTK